MAQKIRWSPRAASNFVSSPLKRGDQGVCSFENLREKIYENYRIVYRLKEEVIEIVAICHGAKLLNNII